MRLSIFLLMLLLGSAVSSCASMFHTSPASVEIIGPEPIILHNSAGRIVRMYHDGPELFAMPEAGTDDSLIVTYAGKSHPIALAKRMSPWLLLDVFSYGLGFVIDDESNKWYNYMAVYVHPDSSGEDFMVSSTNILGERAGRARPDLLLMGGLGFNATVNTPDPLLPVAMVPRFNIKFEFGAGVDLYKKIDLLYLLQDQPSYNLTTELYGETADLTFQSLAARCFVHKSIFVQASYGVGYGTISHYVTDSLGVSHAINTYSKGFPVLGAALGWAGNISYIALDFSTGLKPFSIGGFNAVVFRSIYLDFGLNLQF